MWLRYFLLDFNLTMTPNVLVAMYYNTRAIDFSKDPKFYRKTMNIKRQYHFVHEAIKKQGNSIEYDIYAE